MSANRPFPRFIFAVGTCLLIVASGCASTSAPDDWQSRATAMQQEAYGSWIDVEASSAAGVSSRLRGELIAVSDDSLYVLPLGSTLRAVARDAVRTSTLTTFDANWGYLATWTALGTLSTISHGLVLILSAPVWLLAGSAAAGTQSYSPIYTDPDTDRLRRYARFPQGLPDTVDRNALTAKPID